MEFPSEEWLTTANAALAEHRFGGADVVVQQRIIDRGEERFIHLSVRDGLATFNAGEHPDAPVVLVQRLDTAQAIRAGNLDPLSAIESGALRVEGDVRVLIEHRDTLGSIDAVLR